jgi:hypothetical protein
MKGKQGEMGRLRCEHIVCIICSFMKHKLLCLLMSSLSWSPMLLPLLPLCPAAVRDLAGVTRRVAPPEATSTESGERIVEPAYGGLPCCCCGVCWACGPVCGCGCCFCSLSASVERIATASLRVTELGVRGHTMPEQLLLMLIRAIFSPPGNKNRNQRHGHCI